MAVPLTVLPGGAAGVALPHPLSPSDAVLVRRILVAQTHGQMAEAERDTDRLESPLLLGDILADRYLGPYHVSTPKELSDWLDRYGDQPDAPAVYALLLRKLPKGAAPPPEPRIEALATAAHVVLNRNDAAEDIDTIPITRNPVIDRKVIGLAAAGDDAAALRVIAADKSLTPSYRAVLRGELAHVLFTQNRDSRALEIAGESVRNTPPDQRAAIDGLIAGLAAWRMELPNMAAAYFGDAARAPVASVAQHAAAAFWAARASRRVGEPVSASYWLHDAAKDPRTFYGLIARRALRMHAGIVPDRDVLTQADVDAIASTTHGLRAFALLQVGQTERADAELRILWRDAKTDPAFARALRLVASSAGLVELAAQLTALTESEEGAAHATLDLPLPALHPEGGFRIDPAFVYALTRLESDFDNGLVSPAGARGLMQIMPQTAQFITHDPSLAGDRLHDAPFNLALGQRYFAYLATQDGVAHDLLSVLASYNAGPGSFAKWAPLVQDDNDPLLFIEAIPIAETRAFVRHALTYAWIYAARLGRPAPGLDAIVAGEFPRFTRVPRTGTVMAAVPTIH